MENKVEVKVNNAGTESNKLCVVDLGNFNVKAINGNGEMVTFQSNLSREEEEYPEVLKFVKLEGEYTFFEKGSFQNDFIKTSKNYTAQLLYAISSLYESEDIIETDLVLLLPISEMKEKQKYLDLKGKEFEFTVRVNRIKDKIIKINDVFVTPEGYSSYFTLKDEVKDSNLLLIDVGGRSTDIVSFEHGNPKTLKTYRIGILDFYKKIQNLNSDKEYKLEQIKTAIEDGDLKITKKQLGAFVNDIINEIKIHVNLTHYKHVIWTGGASKMLEDVIAELPKQCYVHENPLYSNILGALEVGRIAFNKVEKVGA